MIHRQSCPDRGIHEGWFRGAVAGALLISVIAIWGCRSPDEGTPGEVSVETVSVDAPAVTESFVPTLSGPLRALALTPRGTLLQMPRRPVITVTFSQPMVPLGDAPDVPSGLFTIDPQIDGSARWEGSQTAVFEPATPFVPATAYRVTVARDMAITAVSGDPLVEPISWTFETPRPRLDRTLPIENSVDVRPSDSVKLFFNQAVVPAEVEERVSLLLQAGRRRVEAKLVTLNDSSFTLVPDRDLTLETKYLIRLEEGVPGVRGELRSSTSFEIPFTTHARLRLSDVVQREGYQTLRRSPFSPAAGIRLIFSTPVRFEDLRESLSFEPEIDWPVGIEVRDANVATVHDIGIVFRQNTAYTVTIRNLEDAYGQRLDVVSRPFRTGAFRPTVYMPSGMLVIEADQTAAIPVDATNMDYVTVAARSLSADDVVRWLPVFDSRHFYNMETDAVVPEPTTRMSLERSKGGGATIPLRLDSLLTGGTGLVGIRMTAQQAGGAQFRALAQVTRLGVTAKFSPHANLVFVTELSSGDPVEGATVTVRGPQNRVLWTGRTGDDGRVRTPGWAPLRIEGGDEWSRPVQFVFVEKDGDLAFTSSEHDDGLEPYRFGVWYHWRPQAVNYAGSVFSDRGLYRAGETVHLKGIVRQMTDGDWQPVTDSVRVVLLTPRDEVAFDRSVRPSGLGTFHLDYSVPSSAAQGFFRLVVARRDSTPAQELEWSARSNIASGSFRVDAFRTATFSVETRTSADSYVAGDFFEGSISGRYLFGAAMRGQPVRYFLSRSRGYHRPPGFDGYQFSQAFDWRRSSEVSGLLAQADTVLGAEGTLDVRVPLPGNELGMPLRLSFDATVTDPARQEMSGRSSLTLHPGLFCIGIKPHTTFLDLQRQRSITADFVAVDPGGAFAGSQELDVQLVRRQWLSVREVGADGRLRWRSEVEEEVMEEAKIETRAGSAQRVRFPVDAGGSYLIRAEGMDLRGNVVRTDAYFYATGSGYVAWQRSDDDRIELVADRDDYRPGETAKVMVQSPFEEATALISVEREGIISSRVETLVGGAPQIEILLGEEHMPNAFVSVILLHGRSAPPTTHQDTGAPAFKIGYLNLRVDPGERHLTVDVLPEAGQYRPGEEVTVRLRLKNSRGEGVPGEITFSAADAGVLNLIGYRLPDPFDVFYGPRSLHVSTSEARANLVRQRNYGQKEEDRGGGGGDADYLLRTDFRPSAHWAPAIDTDFRGHAEITFRLPESLTTFRLMAAAMSPANEFGVGSTDIVVTQPLVMQPALPRFARIGDEMEAGVLVTNTTGEGGEVTVAAETEGLRLEGPISKTLFLDDGDTREIRFQWGVPRVGDNTVTFSATLGAERDALRTSIPVMLPTTRDVSATLASTDDTATELLRLPAERLTELDHFSVNVSSTALAGLEGAVDYLFRYPYGCLEQRTSRIRPLLLAGDLIDAFGIETVGGRRDELIQEWFDEIDEYWTGQGFTYWRGGYTAHVYLSAYVLLALSEAADAGYDLPQPITSESLQWLESRVRAKSNKPPFYSADAWTTSRAFMLYVLARHGRVLRADIDELAAALPATQTFANAEAASHLLRAVDARLRGHDGGEPALERHRAPLLDLLKRQIRVEPRGAYLDVPEDPDYGWIYPSSVRATAYGVIALSESDDDPDRLRLVQRMVRYIIEARSGGWWQSTQDNAVVVDALKTFYNTFEEQEPNFTAEVRMAGERILRETFRGRSLAVVPRQVSIEKLASLETVPVEISTEGEGRLYYDLMIETYSTEPQQPLSRGLRVERRIQRIDDGGQPAGQPFVTGGRDLTLQGGEMVLVTLTLTSPSDRNYVVVDDALPAGLEAINTSFVTSDRVATEGSGSDRWWGSFNHTEIRDDRVLLFADYLERGEHRYSYVARATTPGSFVHPPVRAELMYSPEVRGRNATGRLIVAAEEEETAGLRSVPR